MYCIRTCLQLALHFVAPLTVQNVSETAQAQSQTAKYADRDPDGDLIHYPQTYLQVPGHYSRCTKKRQNLDATLKSPTLNPCLPTAIGT